MSFTDYVQDTAQKYKLAVAIGVIKSKPDNQSIETYLKELRGRMNDDLDDSVCSDDFLIDLSCIDQCNDEENQSIVNELEANKVIDYDNSQIIDENTQDSNIDTIEVRPNHLETVKNIIHDKTPNLDISTQFNLEEQENIVEHTTMQNEKNNQHDVRNNTQRKSDIVKDSNNSVNNKTDDKPITMNEQKTERNPTVKNLIHGQVKSKNHIVDEEVACSEMNNNETQMLDERSNGSLDLLEDYSHIANPVDEADDFEALLDLDGIGRGINKNLHESHQTDTQATYCDSQLGAIIDNPAPNKSTKTHAFNSANNKNCEIPNCGILPNNFCDSQQTELYTVPEFTQNCTHYSQSQNVVVLPDKYLFHQNKNPSIKQFNKSAVNISNNLVEDSQNIDVDLNINSDFNDKNTVELSKTVEDSENIFFDMNDYCNMKSIESAVVNEPQNKDNVFNKNTNASGSTNVSRNVKILNIEPRIVTENGSSVVWDNIAKGTTDNEDLMDIDDDNSLDKEISQRESSQTLVPFKVIEELNKIKNYLNKKNEKQYSSQCFSSDSAYRSDSQNSQFSQRSRTSLQPPCMNQSGHSLLSFLATCHFSTNTSDIVETISQVFGQLIDRLHDEENCPTFFQDLLEKVDCLLNEIFNDIDLSEDTLTKKDEIIHRLILFNRSQHIIKYTIEKIIATLIEVHRKITDPEKTYELKNAVEIENLCYIFNVLEILLKKYKGLKPAEIISNSAETENSENCSQVSRLKRSSISEIWRKKWKISKEKESIEKREDGVCVLKKCGEILNKIVVETIDEYSLVSYAALQCFNVLQS